MVILDGWGVGQPNSSNPIFTAKPPTIEYIKHNYPAGTFQASGIAVGLPWGENGDSEVGHLTLGAGKVLYQHLPRISLEIRNQTFFKNKPLLDAFAHAKQNNSSVNFVGLIGEGNIHSSFEHLKALIHLAKEQNVSNINFHLFTDGVDGPPKSAMRFIEQLPQERIASISGRYFAMDRDLHWEKTEDVYNVMTGIGPSRNASGNPDIQEFLNKFYKLKLTDEFIEPTLIRQELAVGENDSIIFFNFREDSMRQITEMFINPNAGKEHQIPKNLYITTFTQYSKEFSLPVAFPSEVVTHPLGRVLSDAGKVQLRIAETLRYAHVTYFFNGFREEPFENEYRVIIPSRNDVHPDEHPQMVARQVTTRALSAINEGIYDFVLINYANTDVIGHTGNIDAATEAIKFVDAQIKILMDAILVNNGILVITSDHGNVELMINPQTGIRETTHNRNPVPLYVVTRGYERVKNDTAVREIERINTGVLSDIAPIVLNLMGIPKPKEMTGINLLQSLM